MKLFNFVYDATKEVLKGGLLYYSWMAFLLLVMIFAVNSYSYQLEHGLLVTNMRDQVSWGLYIANFTFMVGVAAAAVLLVIPAYIYDFKAIKEIVILGELMAFTAIIMCLAFITVDLGRPDRFWHILPGLGILNLPFSMLSWDFIVLNGYLVLNMLIPFYLLYTGYIGQEPNKKWIMPFIILSIPWAISIHTVTAFLYNPLPGRPFWNTAILAPRFLASAFCSGPAIIVIVFQIIRRFSNIKIQDAALFKLAEMMAYAMFFNLFLLVAELFKEYYSATVHLAPMQYLMQGLHGYNALVPWIWTAITLNVSAFVIFALLRNIRNLKLLNVGCVMIIIGVWIEKGMGLI
ncbi:MAG: NrfD/PsrC family molybdoenzyme membrane anchor subunit, partial [Smithellaceae bacterium]|nr:NrfD/PsrC family molybdoenzyme membrane anchor subunit [Smithellaceae bacterium]